MSSAQQRLKEEFGFKKKRILEELASNAPDASPKGKVDDLILPLIELLNGTDGMVTTSSCSGRVSVFLQGNKSVGKSQLHNELEDSPAKEPETTAGIGGKGGGGRWLFVSHEALPEELMAGSLGDNSFLDMLFGSLKSKDSTEHPVQILAESRFVHLKFEPMILHVLTENIETANRLLSGAINSSFRESGIVSPLRNPIVAVRTNGLAFDAPIGVYDPDIDAIVRFVDFAGLKALLRVANDRFEENAKRMQSLYQSLLPIDGSPALKIETKEERAERKRKEGLEKKVEKASNHQSSHQTQIDPFEDGPLFS